MNVLLAVLLLSSQAGDGHTETEKPPEWQEKKAPKEEPPPPVDKPKEKPVDKPPEAKPKPAPAKPKAQPKPQPKPVAKPQPKPQPKPVAKPVERPAPAKPKGQFDDFRAKVLADLNTLSDKSTDADRERVCGQWTPRGFAEAEPTLFARLKMCHLLAGLARADVNQRLQAAESAVRAAGPGLVTRRMKAELLLVRAGQKKNALLKEPRCSVELGLRSLRRGEVERLQRELDAVVSDFGEVISLRETGATHRALFEVAHLYAELDRVLRTEPPKSYRLVRAEDPLSVGALDPELLLRDTPLGTPLWANEVLRVLSVLKAEPALEPTLKVKVVALEDALKRREASFGVAEKNPFAVPPAGAFKSTPNGFMQSTNAAWRPIGEVEARKILARQIGAGPKEPTWPWAILAHVRAGGEVTEAQWSAGLASDSQAARIAVLAGIAHNASAKPYEALVAHAAKVKMAGAFSTLSGALFGEAEWTLRAIRAVVAKDRNLALQLTYTSKVPMEERLWLVTELGDQKLYFRLQEMAHGSDRQLALAIYASFKAAGERMSWMLRRSGGELTRCVSRAVQEELTTRKAQALDPLAQQP